MDETTIFKFKKWLWQKFSRLLGEDRAYAKYLTHFNHYQWHVVDGDLQKDLNIHPMSKEAFLKVWKPTKKCKSGCC